MLVIYEQEVLTHFQNEILHVAHNLLTELGKIRKIRSVSGIEHYDAETHEHYHLVCRSCGRVLDLPMEAIRDLDRLAEQGGVGTVEGHALVFYGCCTGCLDSPKDTLA